jgi:transcriptional regulator with XRE-family HTH domain
MQQNLPRYASGQLRAEIARRDLTVRELAELLGVSEMWVSRRSRGRVQLSLADIERISDALGLPTQFFTDRTAA